MKTWLLLLTMSGLGWAVLRAAIDGPRTATEAETATEPATVTATATALLSSVPDFESRLEREVLHPLLARQERAERALFSRAMPSRELIRFDFSRVEVPERWQPVAAAAIALEIGGARRLIPVRCTRPDLPLELPVSGEWRPAEAWISDRRSDFALAGEAAEVLVTSPAAAGGGSPLP